MYSAIMAPPLPPANLRVASQGTRATGTTALGEKDCHRNCYLSTGNVDQAALRARQRGMITP